MTPPPRPVERAALTAFTLLTLSPVLATGLYGPLAGALGPPPHALAWTCSAVVMGALGAASAVLSAPAWLTGGIAAGFAVAAGVALGDGSPALVIVPALLGTWGASLVTGRWLAPRLPRPLDGFASRRRGTTALLVVLGAAAVVETTRLSTFMADASRADLSLVPDIPFLVHHSCLSAYVEGERLASAGVTNVYEAARWPDLSGAPRSDAPTGPYAPFNLDAFAYPPPFLLAPKALLSWLGSFAAKRATWYAVNGVVVAAGLLVVGTWLAGDGGLGALLCAGAVWLSPQLLATLQVGNAHALVVVAAMLALVAFETRRPALGGALLAFAVVSKLSPALLLIPLLLRGRLREVAWTAAFGAAFVVVGLATFGPALFLAFVSYQLPRLSSGEALTFLAGPDTVPMNLSPFGIPFKLALWGAPVTDPWALARWIGRAFTIGLLLVTVLAGRKEGGAREQAEVWLALLTLSALQSPLAPGYVLFPFLWLLTVCRRSDGKAANAAVVALWAFLCVIPPQIPALFAAVTTLQQALVIGSCAYVLARPTPNFTKLSR